MGAEPVRLKVVGAPVDAVGMEEAVSLVDASLSRGDMRRCILAMNPEKAIVLERDAGLRRFFEGAFLVVPDGIGVVLAAGILYGRRLSRVTGADLAERLCELAARRRYRVFLYGARDEVNRKAAATLVERYPGLEVAGRSHGYVPREEMSGLVGGINAARPDILFVALGSPAQERWVQEYLPSLEVGVCQCVGGTLDTLAGTTRRAPKAVQRIGLEWLYRLLSQPARARRQVALPLFAARVLREKLGSWR